MNIQLEDQSVTDSVENLTKKIDLLCNRVKAPKALKVKKKAEKVIWPKSRIDIQPLLKQQTALKYRPVSVLKHRRESRPETTQLIKQCYYGEVQTDPKTKL